MLDNIVINHDATILDALIKIDNNKKKFILVEKEGKIIGTLSDGDIRRALIDKRGLDNKILNIANKKFKRAYKDYKFKDIVEIFKARDIDYIPILDYDESLINIVTKKNVHNIILNNIKYDVNYRFMDLDDSILEYEIYMKPWGYYKTTLLNEYFQSKILKVDPGEKLSLQEHKKREEHWIIVKGEAKVQIGESIKKATEGDYIYIPKSCKHRLENNSKDQDLLVVEVQLGTYFGEDDIIRYDDIYMRR